MNTFFNRIALLFCGFFIFLIGNYSVLAQSKKDSLPSYTKEWKLNAFNLLVFQALDVSYEKYIDEESSYGFTGLVSLAGESRFDDNAPFYYETAAFSSFYRIYFGRGVNHGFFIEAFGALSFGKYDSYQDYYYEDVSFNDPYATFTEVGLGFSVGGKFITKEKYTLSVFGGAARNFISKDGPGAMPRVGITIGKRF
ncbi:MAG: hypothetical protein ACPG8F_02865 [Flavobacteriaceae bacterium]